MAEYITCAFCFESFTSRELFKEHLVFRCFEYQNMPIPHMHVAKYNHDKLTDECDFCGRDLRDPIHRRKRTEEGDEER